MIDLTITRSGELGVSQVQGETDAGVEFVDGWLPTGGMTVVDSGRIIIPTDNIGEFEQAATECGLTFEHVEGL